MLNFGMAPGDTLAFFALSADVRAMIPIEEGLSVAAKAQVALISMPFGTSEEFHHIGFCLVTVTLSCSVKGLLSC
jgi:hypothetical protein